MATDIPLNTGEEEARNEKSLWYFSKAYPLIVLIVYVKKRTPADWSGSRFLLITVKNKKIGVKEHIKDDQNMDLLMFVSLKYFVKYISTFTFSKSPIDETIGRMTLSGFTFKNFANSMDKINNIIKIILVNEQAINELEIIEKFWWKDVTPENMLCAVPTIPIVNPIIADCIITKFELSKTYLKYFPFSNIGDCLKDDKYIANINSIFPLNESIQLASSNSGTLFNDLSCVAESNELPVNINPPNDINRPGIDCVKSDPLYEFTFSTSFTIKIVGKRLIK